MSPGTWRRIIETCLGCLCNLCSSCTLLIYGETLLVIIHAMWLSCQSANSGAPSPAKPFSLPRSLYLKVFEIFTSSLGWNENPGNPGLYSEPPVLSHDWSWSPVQWHLPDSLSLWALLWQVPSQGRACRLTRMFRSAAHQAMDLAEVYTRKSRTTALKNNVDNGVTFGARHNILGVLLFF